MRGSGKLTARGVESAPVGLHGDGGGLYLRVGQSGARRWCFIFRRGPKRTELGLGGYPAVPLANARLRAAELRRHLADGMDLLAVRHSARPAPAAPTVTFGAAAEAFVDAMAPQFRNAKHLQQWRMTLGVHAGRLHGVPVGDVTTEKVLAVLQPIWGKTPETAARLRGRIERVLDYARVQGWRCGENPARWRGHLDNVLPRRAPFARGRHAALPYLEVPSFLALLSSREAGSAGAMALIFTILTAARTGETLGARWEEIDDARALWVVPAHRMKAGREHRVPLSEPAIALLARLPRQDGNPFVFAGARAGRPLSNMVMEMTLRRLGRGDVTVHGFRSSFRDWAAERTDHANEVCEAALAHVVANRVEAAYRRGDLLEKRRKLMEEWGRFCAVECR